MGDRCYLWMKFRPQDAERAAEVLGVRPDRIGADSDGEFEDDQANYGLYEDRLALARGGIPFWGFHEDGWEYGGHRFASTGSGFLFEWMTRWGDYLCLDVNEVTGEPYPRTWSGSGCTLRWSGAHAGSFAARRGPMGRRLRTTRKLREAGHEQVPRGGRVHRGGGNLSAGFRFVGPFETFEDAAQSPSGVGSWIASLWPPEDPDDPR